MEEIVIERPRKVCLRGNGVQGIVTIPGKLARRLAGKYVIVKLVVLDTEIT